MEVNYEQQLRTAPSISPPILDNLLSITTVFLILCPIKEGKTAKVYRIKFKYSSLKENSFWEWHLKEYNYLILD